MAQTSRNKPVPAAATSKSSVNSGDEMLYKMQNTFEKNQKIIYIILGAILLLVGGFFGYKYLIQQPAEEKAAKDLFSTQQYFAADSFNLALNGDGQHPGALSIIKRNGNTKAGNLAKFYAGMSYLKTGDVNNAIKYLSDFDGKGTIIGNLANGALGDAYMDAGKMDKGIEFYKKASVNEDDAYTSALYTFRAGLASERAGKLEDAKKFYQDVKQKYPNSIQARDIDKYLARVGVLTLD